MKNINEIQSNYNRIVDNIAKAKQAADRSDTVRIMAVTKTVSVERINQAVSCGVDLLGENRVQEFLEKCADYKSSEIHFIGGLQTNKVKYIVNRDSKITMIHSVDSLKLAQEIDKRAGNASIKMDILVEVNIAGEASKHGAFPERAGELVEAIHELENIRVRGLMTIPPFGEKPEAGGKHFERMQRLYEDMKSRYELDTLSMGMSGDYEQAILYGANIVRLGTALFGHR